MSKIKFEDGSEDKAYFTIIPNYVLNHSAQCDRDVYIQIKRIAGDSGECYMSQTSLSKQCGISINRLKKSLQYLLEHKWIIDIGNKPVGTKGGKQFVKVYKVSNLWDLNMKFYQDKQKAKGVSQKDTPTTKGVSRDDTKGCHENTKGVSPDDDKEYPINNITIKEYNTREEIIINDISLKKSFVENKELNKLVSATFIKWKGVNHKWENWYKQKPQQEALKRLFTNLDVNQTKLNWILNNLKTLSQTEFIPKLTTPWFLEANYANILSQISKKLNPNNQQATKFIC